MCDCYVWLYWSLAMLVVSAFCTASDSGFLAFAGLLGLYKENFPFFFFYFLVISLLSNVPCFVAVGGSAVSWVV